MRMTMLVAGERADAPRDADETGPVHAKAGRGRFFGYPADPDDVV
jgi:hypothetical protein